MESAVRYDFSFPPKSTNSNLLQSAAGCHNMNPPMNQHHGNNNNMRNQHHGHKNNSQQQHGYNTGLLPKSASTSLLTCSAHSSSNNINGSNKLNNNYCNNCNNCASNKDLLNNNSMLQNNLNMKQQQQQQQGCVGGMSNKHHTVIKPSSLMLNQNQQMHHGAIVNSIGQAIANGPQTPKDSNCSFSKHWLFLSYLIIFGLTFY